MFSAKTLSIAMLLASASAAPTTTLPTPISKTGHLTGVTHTVSAGLGGLHFDPDNVVAEVGEIVEWHFLPKNHSVAQSSFDEPCAPNYGGFFSGFNFVTPEGQAPDVFQLVVEHTKPIWYYCAQQVGNHCQNGMAGVINQNFGKGGATLAEYKVNAAKTGTSVIPPEVQGGNVIPNPNPNGGF